MPNPWLTRCSKIQIAPQSSLLQNAITTPANWIHQATPAIQNLCLGLQPTSISQKNSFCHLCLNPGSSYETLSPVKAQQRESVCPMMSSATMRTNGQQRRAFFCAKGVSDITCTHDFMSDEMEWTTASLVMICACHPCAWVMWVGCTVLRRYGSNQKCWKSGEAVPRVCYTQAVNSGKRREINQHPRKKWYESKIYQHPR